MNLIDRFVKPVYAHCDLPCGIYDTHAMRQAAATCLRMIEKIEALGTVNEENSTEHSAFIRAIMIKEKHAQLCKEQIYMLWSDYFKPEHLQKVPDLHDKFWQAAKQCSKVKQTVSRDECQKLIEIVTEIHEIFVSTKK